MFKQILFSLETALERIGVDRFQTCYTTGRILETLGCLDSAIFCYGRKLEASPVDKKILERLGKTMERKKTFPSAVKAKWGFIYDPDDICLCRWTLFHEATQWFEQVKKAIPEGSQPSGSQRHIAMLAVYPWWISIFLAIAAVLVRMGHKVDVFWLPYDRPEHDDPKWVTGLIKREMRALESADLHQNISLICLHDIESAKLPSHIFEIIEAQSFLDIRTHKKSPTVDLSSEADAKSYRFRLARNTDAAASIDLSSVLYLTPAVTDNLSLTA